MSGCYSPGQGFTLQMFPELPLGAGHCTMKIHQGGAQGTHILEVGGGVQITKDECYKREVQGEPEHEQKSLN